jgi:hypothetical protein
LAADGVTERCTDADHRRECTLRKIESPGTACTIRDCENRNNAKDGRASDCSN